MRETWSPYATLVIVGWIPHFDPSLATVFPETYEASEEFVEGLKNFARDHHTGVERYREIIRGKGRIEVGTGSTFGAEEAQRPERSEGLRQPQESTPGASPTIQVAYAPPRRGPEPPALHEPHEA